MILSMDGQVLTVVHYGKRPTTSGDGFGGSLSLSHDEWIATNAKGADMGVGGSNAVPFPFGCMLCQDKGEMVVFMVTEPGVVRTVGIICGHYDLSGEGPITQDSALSTGAGIQKWFQSLKV